LHRAVIHAAHLAGHSAAGDAVAVATAGEVAPVVTTLPFVFVSVAVLHAAAKKPRASTTKSVPYFLMAEFITVFS
jgi:hypothetical protein